MVAEHEVAVLPVLVPTSAATELTKHTLFQDLSWANRFHITYNSSGVES